MSWSINLLKKVTSSGDEPSRSAPINIKALSKKIDSLKCTKPSSEKTGNLDNEQIRKLIPLRNLDFDTFSYLPHKFLTYPSQSIVFIRNKPSKYIYYLLKGSINLSTEGNEGLLIHGSTTRATYPLSSGSKYGATAVTQSESLILAISPDVTRLLTEKNTDEEESFEFFNIELPNEINNLEFFQDFIETYLHNQLKLPSLPHIAMKLRSAMQEEISIEKAVDIIQVDHAMTAKLIQISNSPLYMPISPINNCHDAISMLGLDATRNIVVSLSLKQLFESDDKFIMDMMKQLWKNSLYISSLAFILAEETKTVDPDDALVAGLMCDIGIIPLLTFASNYQGRKPSARELKIAIPYFRQPIGELLLNNLELPQQLVQIPRYAEDWYYDNPQKDINLIDVVILAKLHSYFGQKEADSLPCINTIPAYAKLEKNKLSSDLSLTLLRRAKLRINSIMSELS